MWGNLPGAPAGQVLARAGVALKTFEVTLLPEIQKRYKAWVKKRQKRRKKK